MRRAIDQILRFAPSMRPPMLPVVSRTKATSTRGAAAAGAVALVTATRAGEFGRSKGSATGATARNRNGIKTGMVGLQDDYRQAACLFQDLSPTPPNPPIRRNVGSRLWPLGFGPNARALRPLQRRRLSAEPSCGIRCGRRYPHPI